MAAIHGRYYKLPYLDATKQPQISCGVVNKLKSPLRNAVNSCRQDDVNMKELINLLETSLAHIQQLEVKRKKRISRQKPEPKSAVSLT